MNTEDASIKSEKDGSSTSSPTVSNERNSNERHSHERHSNDRPRRLTAVACGECRKRKRKCDGQRPACSACRSRGHRCGYDTAEGNTRNGDLKQKVQSLTSRLGELETLVDKLRTSSDNEASMLLVRLRLGDEVENILSSHENGMSDATFGMPSRDQVVKHRTNSMYEFDSEQAMLAYHSSSTSARGSVSGNLMSGQQLDGDGQDTGLPWQTQEGVYHQPQYATMYQNNITPVSSGPDQGASFGDRRGNNYQLPDYPTHAPKHMEWQPGYEDSRHQP